VIALVTERIETAVTEGRLSRERADEMLENLPDRITQLFDEVHDFEDRPLINMAERGLFAYLMQTIVDTTDLSRQEIADEIEAGSTLSEIIVANDGDVDTIKSDVLAELTERLDARVANGDLTQEEADTILAEAGERLDGWLSGELEFPAFGERGGRGEGRGNRGGEGRGERGN
jgi:polyhydroxyalkanoate synthesis regulator phasin